ncbi:hypothetical protein [Bradyrhizobium neotropicale]|uniref:hypothetical protein n=1 Tax=Bradyrhizobium neotropicale TaxID=1497615 RepID=UPI001AD65AFC|nr:hypothetical protein [Bradyrhizobium neotropicale]MBO4227570.1 hypothetical protein [Bradyrhizobium neotropicale]
MVRIGLYVETEQDREEALRLRARDVMRQYRGLLLSLSPEEHQAIAAMDPGSCAMVGRSPETTD